ncbi:ribosome hibernation factor-recruiting GTPase MRF [Rhodococcus sp. NBC_00297]|uniref:ribosome hibernation factor-recruiting GTPase MRF n=1 Tax=Rhodococcus sp. NBC_00297 TaxID=2976005 RepID=UPI002E2A146A|nr:GTP-binding protein [Rhodococcus sp. NBC_00297]
MENLEAPDRRTPLVVVCGPEDLGAAVSATFQEPGTIVLHHDLSDATVGVVRRRTVRVDDDGTPTTRVVDLAGLGCCVSCLLREDLLPLLRSASADSSVRRIVVRVDPSLEVEAICWAIENTVVTGMVGRVDATASRDVRIEAVVGCVDGATWLSDATGDELVGERAFPPGPDGGQVVDLLDDRTVAQVAVGTVRGSDLLVVADTGVDRWDAARLDAVLARLAPRAPRVWILPGERPRDLLAFVPATARRGLIDDAHAPLLDGQPPLSAECGVTLVEFTDRRPFHPGRLHDAIDVLLDGVVATRGRLWVATQPDAVLWLESAGGGLRVASAGSWLAAMAPDDYEEAPTARRALAALAWDEEYGDRAQSLVVLVHEADPEHVYAALSDALLTPDELETPELWAEWADPFGQYHEDPCETEGSAVGADDDRRAAQ